MLQCVAVGSSGLQFVRRCWLRLVPIHRHTRYQWCSEYSMRVAVSVAVCEEVLAEGGSSISSHTVFESH